MNIKFFDKNIKKPKKHYEDAGAYDCFIPKSFEIKPFETLVMSLGFGIEVPKGYASMLIPRSSISKKGLIIQTSVIDPGYQGEIHLIVTNCSNNYYYFDKDSRICSLITYKYLDDELMETQNFVNETERGINGLGHSGI